jgi:DNA-binding PadR family transcriptional regulator
MKNTKGTRKRLSLIGRYKIVKIDTSNDYKAEYNRMFPTKMSSSNFLLLYTLYLLDKRDEALYGKEMLREVQRIVSVDVWKPSHGTYYPLLEEMVQANYIKNVKTTSGKKYYAITELGIEELGLRLGEFRTMLMGSTKFFSKILAEMYNEVEDKDVPTNTTIAEEKLDASFNSLFGRYSEVVELLTSINDEVKEVGIKIEDQCVEIRVIKPVS